MLNLDVLISTKEVAALLHSNPCLVREHVARGIIPGYATDNPNRRNFKIPRLAFYKSMGWTTETEIREGYKMAGVELKEKTTEVAK